MSQKGWILVAGIAAYLVWRGQAMSSATTISGAGSGTASPIVNAIGPGNASVALGTAIVSPIRGY